MEAALAEARALGPQPGAVADREEKRRYFLFLHQKAVVWKPVIRRDWDPMTGTWEGRLGCSSSA
jgi:hypothetical protein